MNKVILQLINKLSNNEIGREQFLRELHLEVGVEVNEDLCLEKLKEALINRDSQAIDMYLSIGFVVGLTGKSVSTLCQLLSSPDHHNHEDVARLMQELKPIDAVECIYKATELEFEYLNYDDTYQFARKCIKALSVIDNPAAIDKLKILSNSRIKKISEYAAKELHYKGVL